MHNGKWIIDNYKFIIMNKIDPEWRDFNNIEEGDNIFPSDLKYSTKAYNKNG